MRVLLLVPVMVAVLSGALAAQDILTGRVRGPDGEAIAGAQVVATSIETGIVRSALSDARGRYVIVYPELGGRYHVRVTFFGMADRVFLAFREADEDVLINDVNLEHRPIPVDGVDVQAVQALPGQGDVGQTGMTLLQELLDILPLYETDPIALALLIAGVVGVDGDSMDLWGAFSVDGLRSDLNQITLDGMMYGSMLTGGAGDSPLGLPEEGLRAISVLTNTYDVSRGEFAGGQIEMTTRGGTNRQQGSLTYWRRDPSLQLGSGPAFNNTNYRLHRFGGGYGGPIIRNRLFVNGSFTFQERADQREALVGDEPEALELLGLHPDSVARFLGLLHDGHGIPTVDQVGQFEQIGDALTLLGRIDFTATEQHSLSFRFDANIFDEDSSGIARLNLKQTGGEVRNRAWGTNFNATSRFGSGWVNTFQISARRSERGTAPLEEMPGGRVRIASEFEDGTRAVRTVTFGGSQSFPQNSNEFSVELSNRLNFLYGTSHRLSVGGNYRTSRFTNERAQNRYGFFAFNSISDFEQGLAESYNRTIVPRERTGGGDTWSLYLNDSWRVTPPLQVQLGVRLDGSYFPLNPGYNPLVDSIFGYRTDVLPRDMQFTPRASFSYRLSARQQANTPARNAPARPQTNDDGDADAEPYAPAPRDPQQGRGGGGMGGGQDRGMGGGQMGGGQMGGMQQGGGRDTRVINGGLGVFRGRAPLNMFASAVDQTGLPNSQMILRCIGDAVPVPDWDAYLRDPLNIPEACVDGTTGQPVVTRTRPDVLLIDPDFVSPATWRASLGLSGVQLPFGNFRGSVEGRYAWGVNLSGVTDLNLNEQPVFYLENEGGRPVYVPPAAIVARSGSVSLLPSRIDQDLRNVYLVRSSHSSRNGSLVFNAQGTLPPMFQVRASYTLNRSWEQSSGGTGASGFSSSTTVHNPNQPGWATANNERRHAIRLTFGVPLGQALTVTATGNITSGTPFTPMVSADINGDGSRNDRAFIFDPATTADSAVAASMMNLLNSSSRRTRNCLISQLGQFAERNSCTGNWSESLSLRLVYQPNLPRWGRRLNISLDGNNVTAALDRLLHGDEKLRGWGQGASRHDNVLLYPRGFNRNTQEFIYRVNESFGETRAQRNPVIRPFQMTLNLRLTLGPQAPRGGNARDRGLAAIGGGREGGGAFNPATFVTRMLGNPVEQVLDLREELHLTDHEIVRIETISDSLAKLTEPLREEVTKLLEEAGANVTAGDATRLMAPVTTKHRENVRWALGDVRDLLGDQRWAGVPTRVANQLRAPEEAGPGAPGGGQPGRGGDPAGGGGVTEGEQFDPAGFVNRVISNPLEQILELRRDLQLTEAEQTSLTAVSDSLEVLIKPLQEEAVKLLVDSNAAAGDAMRIIAPVLTRSREHTRWALEQSRALLGENRWASLPARITNQLRVVREEGPQGF